MQLSIFHSGQDIFIFLKIYLVGFPSFIAFIN